MNEMTPNEIRRTLGMTDLPKTTDVATTLAQRGTRYGDFTDNARVSQELKGAVKAQNGYNRLSPVQREALSMICQKIARILNGDPNYKDNWHDIAGYAKLAEDRCTDGLHKTGD